MSVASHPVAKVETDSVPPPRSERGDWTWELVTMFPRQGEWTEDEYLRREFDGLVEFVDGVLEFLPVPTFSHQDLVIFLFERLNAFIGFRSPREVYVAPVRVRVATGNIREPDVAYIPAGRIRDRQGPADGAELVMEVVSADIRDRERDYVVKRKEYAATGIPEYWIVDPYDQRITVLILEGGEYKRHGEFEPDSTASSVLLRGFEINVADAFAAAMGE